MPFLPSEAEETKLLINQEMKNVLVFHYLPILWYRYPIPNDIREFWYNERPDILDYMQKAYKDLDIQFLPNNVIQQFNQQGDLVTQTTHIKDHLPTQLLSNEFINSINSINAHLNDLFLTYTHNYS